VFPNRENNEDMRWAERTIPAPIRAAEIKNFRFHDLRHSFASRLAMEGVDLGWKSLPMVQRYAHRLERLATRQPELQAQAAFRTE
jgi:integrase